MAEDEWRAKQALEESRYHQEHPSFKGTHEFDIAFEQLGERVTRRAGVL